ncbi:putative calcium-binding protein CML29 [Camellia lanceoleosa]|uniref:Calcium-binding protein CML29 n=1 Tax=Camellia lanceoleosa TaxID=1840588 RepID=A0ACC0HQB8_9ERIC|nr:putative calcium-binding protein CML29 [Camellia lanceoleosa]
MAQLGSLSAETETLSHVSRLVEAFRAFDSDNDGSITAAELRGIMSSLGYNPSEEDVEAMMQKGDKNKDGVLSIEEFLEMNTNELGLGGLQIHLTIALQALDVADDEDLTAKELHEVLGNMQGGDLSLKYCEEVIASMDRDDDGAISFEDFKLIVNALL